MISRKWYKKTMDARNRAGDRSCGQPGAVQSVGAALRTEKLFGGLSMATPVSTRSLRSQRRTGSALARELTRGMTSRSLSPRYRARLGPVHARRPLCLLGCASSVASLVSAEYPSTKQLLTFFRLRVTPTEETQRDAEVPTRQMQYSCNPAHRCPARGARNVCRASLRLPSDVKGLFPAGASLEQRRAAAL